MVPNKSNHQKRKFRLSFTGFLLVVAAVLPYFGKGQDVGSIWDYSNPRRYRIESIRVEGAYFTDKNAVIGVTGLQVGDTISIPGAEIQNALRALWKLRLFTDIEIGIDSVFGDKVYLFIQLKEQPRLSGYAFKGVKKSKHEDLIEIVEQHLKKGSIITANALSEAKLALRNHYVDKGYLDATVHVDTLPDTVRLNSVKLIFHIDKGPRIKIRDITFGGNRVFSDSRLRRQLKHTKRMYSIFKKSKFVREDYEEDKRRLIQFYNRHGYRDMRIAGEALWRDENNRLHIHLHIEEGPQYHFRHIRWKGNTLYSDEYLSKILGIEKGDVFNSELLQKRLTFSLDGRDISSLYMDDGYLAFRAIPVETAVEGDSIDIEIRITEGPQFTIGAVRIHGNDRTHEHVIRRELRTLPGHTFSRSDIIRSQREIINLGYFNPEKIGINTPINLNRGTVDIDYTVEERSSDQFEMSAGYQGYYGLFSTFGLVFNNFSLQNIRDRSKWNPLPQGDGQKLQLRFQSNGKAYYSFNFSFIEPWLGGRKPRQFAVSAYHSFYSGFGRGFFNITNGSVALGSRLNWPDDNFFTRSSLSIQNIQLSDYPLFFEIDGNLIDSGNFYNLYYTHTFSRISITDPFFPRSGSKLELTVQFTPPYSLFIKNFDPEDKPVAERYRWLEYHKWRFNADWYFSIIDKLVIRSYFKSGFLGYYNRKLGAPPFERFRVGVDPLSNQTQYGITYLGVDFITLRGYNTPQEVVARSSVEWTNQSQLVLNKPVFAKMGMELRYLFLSTPQISLYGMIFAEGGNVWDRFSEFNPFQLKRSVGVGARAQLPMIGLIGVDWGFGFDKPWIQDGYAPPKEYQKFMVIFGFEPE